MKKRNLFILATIVIYIFTFLNVSAQSTRGGSSNNSNSNTSSSVNDNVYVTSIPRGEYYIRINNSSKYWDIPGGPGSDAGAGKVQLYSLDGGKDRKVMFIPAGGNYFYIKFSHNGYYLDAQSGNLNKRDKMQCYLPNRSRAQKFKIKKQGNGTYVFETENGMCIDASNGIKNSSQLILWPYHGGSNQVFQIINVNNKQVQYL